MPVRGCGASRIAGGVYVVVPTSPLGLPVDSFWIDPPRAYSREDLALMGVSPRGMSFIPGKPGEPFSLADWVGSEFYPNVYDLWAEIRAYGVSRRVQRTLNFKLLGPGSRIYLLHDRAQIETGRSLLWAGAPLVDRCPVPTHPHSVNEATAGMIGETDETPMCVRLYRECIEGGSFETALWARFPTLAELGERGVVRQIGDVTYGGRCPPNGVDVTYSPAFFASFPIAGLEVVRDPIGGSHTKALERASQAGLPVAEVDE